MAATIVRAWPGRPPQRPHVVDDLPRLLTDGCEYSGLTKLDGDVIVLDWDIAVDPLHLEAFAARAAAEPGRVRVAPYRKHHHDGTLGWVWEHRRYQDGTLRRIETGEPFCHRFGFGLVYLPRLLIGQFDDQRTGVFDDAQFSEWHYRSIHPPEVAVDWDCPTVHLNHPAVML